MLTIPPFLLFDLDDTLLDYTASGRRCWQELCHEYAPRFGVDARQLLAAQRQTAEWFWSDLERHRTGRLDLRTARRQIMQMTLGNLGIQAASLGNEMADAFTLQREDTVQPFPGAIETLQELQARGVCMSLVTNGSSEFQRIKVRRFALESFFTAIIIEGEFGKGKPDHGLFLAALNGLGASPAQAWMVGDDLVRDIQPAQELGMGTVWVDTEGTGFPADGQVRPERIIHSVVELLLDG